MKTRYTRGLAAILLSGLGLGLGACASALPPQDLVDARSAYARATQGPAGTINPAGLNTAKQQLDVAEAAFTNEGDSQNTRDQAYVAARQTQLAEVVASTMRPRRPGRASSATCTRTRRRRSR